MPVLAENMALFHAAMKRHAAPQTTPSLTHTQTKRRVLQTMQREGVSPPTHTIHACGHKIIRILWLYEAVAPGHATELFILLFGATAL